MTETCGCGGAGRTKKFQPVTHVIFDLDGLLLDSEYVYERVFQSIADQYGKIYTVDIRMKVLGTPELDSARIAVAEMGLPITPEEFIAQYKPICERELAHPPLLPGAEKLLRHLKKHGISVAIATSGAAGITEIKMRDYKDLFSVVHHIVCGTSDPEVKNGKPAPDIYVICADRFDDKPDPKKVLAFEDAPNGVLSARGAKMQVVMIPPKELKPDHPARGIATLVLKSLLDFKPEQFGLPPYDN